MTNKKSQMPDPPAVFCHLSSVIRDSDDQELVPTDSPYPRPMNGIFVAITVMN